MKIELLEKVEGEALLEYSFKGSFIDFVNIKFTSFRGIENILKNRPLFDACAINPRVCGICGHSHLIATSKAIEDILDFKPSLKASNIREITLLCEHIQNHLKWLYLTIIVILGRFGFLKRDFLKVQKAVIAANKIIAIFAGQYPHTSYSLPGGVVSDPTFVEIAQAKAFLLEIRNFFESEILERRVESFRDFENSHLLAAQIFNFLKEKNLAHIGRAYDRFLILSQKKKIINMREHVADTAYLKEEENRDSFAKNVTYKGKFYEVGPMARVLKKPLIKDLHRRYKDSLAVRIISRIYEIREHISKIEHLLENLNLNEPSFISFPKNISGFGEGVVEAPRGSLIHRVFAKNGVIERYDIITPTQFNLSNGTKDNPSASQKAIISLDDTKKAELVFRSFDICSVCTTH